MADSTPTLSTTPPAESPTRSLEASLAEHFGFDTFREGQRPVIESLLAGRSAAAVFPTGGGKSLCYQLPALRLDGLTLVVSPLIALMKDQIDALAARGIAAARLDSSLDADGARDVRERLRSGALKLLYVSPERFANERFRGLLGELQIALFAVDEAHCISEWGHNFRPDYLKLPELARSCGAERVLALTATAAPPVLEDIRRGFQIAAGDVVRTGVYRPNLTLLSTPVTASERDARLEAVLRQRGPQPTIVYVTLQRTAEAVAERLDRAGLPAVAYHAGLDAERRAEIQERFLASDDGIVVATIAFGMGIDKADIRSVVHYNLPKSLENLSQEIGRAGRDGEPAVCEVFACADDLPVLQNFAYGDTPSFEAVRALLADLAPGAGPNGGEPPPLDLYALAKRRDIRPLVLRTLLAHLELDGWIAVGTPLYSVYRFQPQATSAEILDRFEGERREFLRGILRHAKKARTWFDIDLDHTAASLGTQRGRVVRALDYLAELGLLDLRATGVRRPYRWQRHEFDPESLALELHERLLEHEAREIERLGQVIELLTLDSCLIDALSSYFGDPLGRPCGHCSYCLTGEAAELQAPEAPEFDEERFEQAMALRASHRAALGDARALTRFLVGLSSPGLPRELRRHPLYGSFPSAPFDELLMAIESLDES